MAVLLAVLTVGACGDEPEARYPSREVGEPARVAGVTWAPDGSVVVGISTSAIITAGDVRYALEALDLDTGTRTRIELEHPAGCQFIDFFAHGALLDGRLLVFRECNRGIDLPAERDLLALDLLNGDVETLGPAPTRGGPTGLAYLPDERRGWFSTGSRICGGIAPFGPDGMFIDWDVTVGHADAPIELDAFFSWTGMDCPGVADYVLLSGDGTRLAFIAAPDTARQGTGGGRLNAAWNIYVMDIAGPAALQPRLVYEGIEGGIGLAWSPDGYRFAIAGSIGGTEGTWLIPAEGGEAVRVSSLFLSGPQFSPDGTQLLGAHFIDLTARLVLIDLAQAHDVSRPRL